MDNLLDCRGHNHHGRSVRRHELLDGFTRTGTTPSLYTFDWWISRGGNFNVGKNYAYGDSKSRPIPTSSADSTSERRTNRSDSSKSTG